MPARKLKEFLDQNDIRCLTVRHAPAYTAQDIAHTAHISGRELAKTVILRADGDLVMAVLPATHKVDLGLLRDVLGARVLAIAEERDFEDAFPGCELGAMPPFGNLWNVPVYVADCLAEDEDIAFNAGSHVELIQMAYADFERLVKPTVVPLTRTFV